MNSNAFDVAQQLYQKKSSNQTTSNPFDVAERQFNQKLIENEDENDIQREIERSQAQLTSRSLEAVVGLPSDLINFAGNLLGFDPNLPGSQKLREVSENLTQGYTKPKNEMEERTGELFQDISLMALPGAKHYSFARNLGIPIVGNLVKEGLKYNNADDKSQAYGKIGTMIALDLMSGRKGGAKAYVSSLFKKSEESIPKGVSIKATDLEKSLNNLERSLTMGGSRPTTKKALEKVGEIKKEIKNGKIDAKRLAAFRPSINEAIEELGGFQLEVPKKLKPQAIRNLNEVKGQVIKTLEQYGENLNPEYLKYSKSANESYAALQKSNLIANFLRDKVPYSPKSKAVQSLFSFAPHAGALGLIKLSPAASAGAAAGIVGYQGVKVLHQIMNSPTLRKYYQDVLKSASAGNVPHTVRSLKALDKALKAQEIDQEEK
jgi:hypothetical protein